MPSHLRPVACNPHPIDSKPCSVAINFSHPTLHPSRLGALQAMARSNASSNGANASKYASKSRPRATALADTTNGPDVSGGGGVVVASDEFESRMLKMEAVLKEVCSTHEPSHAFHRTHIPSHACSTHAQDGGGPQGGLYYRTHAP
jgi:hypothetical protein